MADKNQLFPVFEVPTVLTEGQTSTDATKYKKSWLFDFETGDFVTDGAHKVKESDGWTTWAQWCTKVVQSSRYGYLAYSSDIGIDDDEIRIQPSRQAAESTYERTVTESLLVHPGTDSVREFNFTWNGDNLTAAFTVYPKEGAPITISNGITT